MQRPDASAAPLSGRKILEIGGALVGYAGRLLADLGAEVIKLERPGGDETRSTPLLFEFHNQSKRSVVVDWSDPRSLPVLARLASAADAVLLGVQPDATVVGLTRGPRLSWAPANAVVCAVSPYGLTGPQSHWRATPMTAFAGSGQMYPVGPVDGPPLPMPGQQPFDIAGLRAAYLVQAGLLAGPADPAPGIDLSVHEAVSWQRLIIEQFSISGRIPDRTTYFSPPPGGVWQCRDGRVDIAAHAPRHWGIFVDALGQPDDLVDPIYADRSMRIQLFDLVAELIAPHMAQVSASEFVERAQAAGLPCALSFEPGGIVQDAQMRKRGYFLTSATSNGERVLPGYPYRSTPPLFAERQPAPDAGNDAIDDVLGATAGRKQVVAVSEQHSNEAPLEGLRVLSLGTFVAGNVAATTLSDLGADVVKIESSRRPEPLRSYHSPDHGELFEPSGMRTTSMFAGLTTGVRSVGLNLDTTVGIEVFRRLASIADVVIENFPPGQMQRWGCGFDELARNRRDLVMVSMSGFGQTGPMAHYRAYASNVANYLGLASAWAHDGMHFDFVAAYHAVGAVLGGVQSVRNGGPSVHVDLAQSEAGAALMAPLYLDQINGGCRWNEPVERDMVIPNVFACAGRDRWAAVDVRDGADFAALERVLELSGSDVDEMAAELRRWCAARTPHQVAWQLQAAGVAAAAVQDLEDLWRDPQLRARGAYRLVNHPDVGPQELPTPPDQVALRSCVTTRPSPRLGQDTHDVLREWLRMTDDAIQGLEADEACWSPVHTRNDHEWATT